MSGSAPTQAMALLLAEQLSAVCTEAVLDWGEAINAYEATPESNPAKAARLSHVQLCGGRVQELAKQSARILRPDRVRR